MVTLDALFGRSSGPAAELLQFNRQMIYDIALGATTAVTLYTGLDYTVKYYSMIKNVLR